MLIAKPINTLLYKILSAFIAIVFLSATEMPLTLKPDTAHSGRLTWNGK